MGPTAVRLLGGPFAGRGYRQKNGSNAKSRAQASADGEERFRALSMFWVLFGGCPRSEWKMPRVLRPTPRARAFFKRGKILLPPKISRRSEGFPRRAGVRNRALTEKRKAWPARAEWWMEFMRPEHSSREMRRRARGEGREAQQAVRSGPRAQREEGSSYHDVCTSS